MKKFLIVKQDGFKECGSASLLSIIRYYHGNISMNRLVELTHTDKNGTNFYYLKVAAENVGLDATGYKVDNIHSLFEIKKPFICQLVDKNYEHFVVVYAIKKNKIIIMDPAQGSRTVIWEEFEKIWTGYIMIFSPRKKLLYYKEQKYLNQIIIDTLLKNKGIVSTILLLSIIFTGISCLYALYTQIILEYIIDTTRNNLLIVTFMFSILLIIKCITSFFRNELLIYLNQKLDCSIFLNTFQKLLLLPYNYYKNRTTGEMISRINDLIYVKNILNKIILTVFLDMILLICYGIILCIMNPIMFIILIVIILIYILCFYVFRPSFKKYISINQQNTAEINSFLVESISGFETIKNISLERIVNERLEILYTKSLTDSFHYDNLSNLEIFIKELVSLVGILLVEFLGFGLVMEDKMVFTTLLTYILLTNSFLEPIKNIIDLSKEYFYAVNSIKRANHLFEVESENLNITTNFIPQGNILLHDLNFSYNEEKYILKHINCTIHKRDRILILGNSGSGKSTILKLLLKYYPIPRDSIYIDEVDLVDYSVENIRRNISCISQNEFLYTDTIRNNIISYRSVSEQEFMEVCKITCVDEFANKLFLGYETRLEENGLNLSGGQRQRIILARMLLKPSKIILVDEGLNAIDINLERKILKNIFSKYPEKTFIVVSHRLENLDLFTQVLRLENGVLEEQIKRTLEELYD